MEKKEIVIRLAIPARFRRRWLVGIAVCILAIAVTATAADYTAFSSGESLSSAKLNANFSALQDRIAALESRAPAVTSTALAGPATAASTTTSATCTTTMKHVLVLATGTAQLTNGSVYVQVALRFDGLQVGTTYAQAPGPHMPVPTISAYLTSVAPGAHPIDITSLQGALFDNRDFWTITCVEFP